MDPRLLRGQVDTTYDSRSFEVPHHHFRRVSVFIVSKELVDDTTHDDDVTGVSNLPNPYGLNPPPPSPFLSMRPPILWET